MNILANIIPKLGDTEYGINIVRYQTTYRNKNRNFVKDS